MSQQPKTPESAVWFREFFDEVNRTFQEYCRGIEQYPLPERVAIIQKLVRLLEADVKAGRVDEKVTVFVIECLSAYKDFLLLDLVAQRLNV